MVMINKHINSLPMIMNWEVDVVSIFFVFFYIAIIVGGNSFFILLGIILLGFLVSFIYQKIKINSISGLGFHILYVLNIIKVKKIIPSYKKIFIGG